MKTTLSPAEANQLDAQLGINVRLQRRSRRISQTELGQSVGVTFQQIQKYEKGTNRISFSMLVGIARALGCAPIDLISDIGAADNRPDKTADASTLLRGQKVTELLEAFANIKSSALRRQTVQLVQQLAQMPLANTASDQADDEREASPSA